MKAKILDFVQMHGEKLVGEIAQSLQLPQAAVSRSVSQLLASGQIICCKVTRYRDGKKIDSISCRVSGSPPRPAQGARIVPTRNAS